MWDILLFLLSPVNDLRHSAEPYEIISSLAPSILVDIILYIPMLVTQQTDFYYEQDWCSLEFTNLFRENNLGYRVKVR